MEAELAQRMQGTLEQPDLSDSESDEDITAEEATDEAKRGCDSSMEDEESMIVDEDSKRYSILSRTELLEYFQQFKSGSKDDNTVVIGMVRFDFPR